MSFVCTGGLYLLNAGRLFHAEGLTQVLHFVTNFSHLYIARVASGCPNIAPPENGWLRRGDDWMVVGCYNTRETWNLTCRGNQWIGTIGNCSDGNDFLPKLYRQQQEQRLSRKSIYTLCLKKHPQCF